jgi:hypothetical protein
MINKEEMRSQSLLTANHCQTQGIVEDLLPLQLSFVCGYVLLMDTVMPLIEGE